MKLFVYFVILLLVVGVFSRSKKISQKNQFQNGIVRRKFTKFSSKSDVQQCEGNSTCQVWYKCPPSRLPRNNIYPPCLYEGYSKWDMGICCTNSKKGVNKNATPKPMPTYPTLATTVYPLNRECGRSMSRPGSKERPGNWPWMVAIRKIERNRTDFHWCNGFIIDRTHVLTAAHCLLDKNIAHYILRIGSFYQRGGDVYYIKKWAIPNSYQTGRFYNDIALVTLNKAISASNYMPICLPDSVFRDFTGTKATFAGWTIDSSSRLTSNFLRELHGIPIMSNAGCENIYRTRISSSLNRLFPSGINNDFICARLPEGARGSCGGDSGGPLMIYRGGHWYAIGILLFGVEKCETHKYPKGYTRISTFINFIQKNL